MREIAAVSVVGTVVEVVWLARSDFVDSPFPHGFLLLLLKVRIFAYRYRCSEHAWISNRDPYYAPARLRPCYRPMEIRWSAVRKYQRPSTPAGEASVRALRRLTPSSRN